MSPFVRIWFAIALVASLSLGCSKYDRSASGAARDSAPAAAAAPVSTPTQRQDGQVGARKALLEIHAQIEMQLSADGKATEAAAKVESFARAKGGYVAESRTEPGYVHVVLRVPPSELPALRALLAGEGTIARQSEQATDVTDSIADLDARLRSARIEESRILKLLEDKSGSIADILAAERALADVRQRIERLEADQRLAQGRVDLATVEITLAHPAVAVEPSLGDRLSEAAHDGVTGVKTVTIFLMTTALRVGPTLLLFGALLGAILLAVRRARKVPRTG